MKVPAGSRRFAQISVCSGMFTMVHEGSNNLQYVIGLSQLHMFEASLRLFKKVQEVSRRLRWCFGSVQYVSIANNMLPHFYILRRLKKFQEGP